MNSVVILIKSVFNNSDNHYYYQAFLWKVHINDIYKILYYDITDVFDVNKWSEFIECIACHYCYISDKGFKFQSSACNGCHDVLMMSIDINSITILDIHGVDYRCIIAGICKSEAINIFKNPNLSRKVDHY